MHSEGTCKNRNNRYHNVNGRHYYTGGADVGKYDTALAKSSVAVTSTSRHEKPMLMAPASTLPSVASVLTTFLIMTTSVRLQSGRPHVGFGGSGGVLCFRGKGRKLNVQCWVWAGLWLALHLARTTPAWWGCGPGPIQLDIKLYYIEHP